MKTSHFKRWINDIINPGGKRMPVRNEVPEASRLTEINRQLSVNSGGEEIPVGGWRGGEEIPVGGWRGGEEIPVGGWRGGEEIPVGGWRGGEEIPVGGWRGGEEIPVGGWRGGEEIPIGGWRASSPLVFDVYRSKDGINFFEFYFFWTGSNFEIDIFNMPSYNGREDDLHSTHRLKSDRGGYRICFGDPLEIDTLNKARKWAGIWSELTTSYIKTGEKFPNNEN